jgi:guanylate kinase
MNIFVIAGPSGVGKTHLITELGKEGIYPLEVYTDRKRRPTEKDTTDRVYLSEEQFSHSLSDFLYWFEFQGNRYGYKRSDIEHNKKTKRSIVFNIPPTFLPDLLKKLPEAIVIYLKVNKSNFGLLYDRMVARDIGKNDNEVTKEKKIVKIKRRLEFALREMENTADLEELILKNPFSKVFVINDDIALYKEVIPHILKVNNTN